MLMDKSRENLEAASILYDRKFYGLAAYHAQQSIETLFKAYVYQILRKYPEFSETQLVSHLPIKDVLEILARFSKDLETRIASKRMMQFRGFQASHEPEAFGLQLSPVLVFNELKNFIDQLGMKRGGFRLRMSLWKHSLNIGTKKEPELDRILKIADEISKDQSQDTFTEKMISLAQSILPNLHRIYGPSAMVYLDDLRPLMIQYLVGHGFPPMTLYKMFYGKTINDEDRSELRDFVISKGGPEVLSIYFGNNGLLNRVVELAKTHYPATYREAEKYFDYQALSYASAICGTMILLYPHETFGRYPEPVDDVTTEVIYSQKSDKILGYIEDCRKAQQRIKAMM